MAVNHSQTSGIIRISMYFLLSIWQWVKVYSSHVFFLWLTHSLASRSHWYSKPPAIAREDFKVTPLVVCSPVHRLGKSFSKPCYPHTKQEVDLDQTFPIHNNSRQEYWSGVPLPSPYARLREGILRSCIKILQLLGNCAKSIFNKAVSSQMDISWILPGNSAAFNN